MEKQKRGFKLTQTLIIVGIIAAIGLSFIINVLGTNKHEGVPDTLLEMKVGNYVSGDEALSQVNHLHGTGIELTDAIIADYSHSFNPYHKNDELVSVWVGKTRTAADAESLVDEMYQAIQQAKGSTPFANAQQKTIDNRELFEVEGPGGRHFFYAVDGPEPRVIWLTIYSDKTEAVLIEALRSF